MHCLTQGLGTILEARELVLVALGEATAEAVAAARLRLADHYRCTYAHRDAAQTRSSRSSRP